MKNYGIYHGQINGNVDLKIQRDYVFDGAMNIKNLNIQGNVVFQAHPLVHNYVPSDSTYWAMGSGLDPVMAVDILKNESFQTAPTTENELQSREFVFENITLKDATLSLKVPTLRLQQLLLVRIIQLSLLAVAKSILMNLMEKMSEALLVAVKIPLLNAKNMTLMILNSNTIQISHKKT